jgi:hypothetical protein
LYKRLKEEPLGFPVTDGYSCDVCGVLLNISTGWHSQYGITCIYCRNAYQNGVLPLYISKHPNSFFNLAQLHHTFGITRQHIFKYIKEYVLFPVLITKEDGSIYTYIFLKKDNLGLYDPVCPISKSIMRYNKKIMTQWTYKRIQKIKAQ